MRSKSLHHHKGGRRSFLPLKPFQEGRQSSVQKEGSMPRIAQALAVLAVLLVAVPSVRAQQPPRPENPRDVFLAGWTEVGEKLVKMAEEFPEDKFEYKPANGVRTFGDVLRHVAFWNQWVAKAARGE